jgi:hypothetical protein
MAQVPNLGLRVPQLSWRNVREEERERKGRVPFQGNCQSHPAVRWRNGSQDYYEFLQEALSSELIEGRLPVSVGEIIY